MPRRRAARRPAGPPDEPAAQNAGPGASTPRIPQQPTVPEAVLTTPDPGGASADMEDSKVGESPHRRRQRAAKARVEATSEPVRVAEPSFPVEQASSARTSERPFRPRDEVTGRDRRRESAGPVRGRGDPSRGETAMERSLRALVSLRSTQLAPDIAMRAREVAAPTAADLKAADEELVLVRRHYVPSAPLTTQKRGDQPAQGRASDQRGRTESRRGGRKPQRGSGSGI